MAKKKTTKKTTKKTEARSNIDWSQVGVSKKTAKKTAKKKIERPKTAKADLDAPDYVNHLSPDIRKAIQESTPDQLKYVLDYYYRFQDPRKRADSQADQLYAKNLPYRFMDLLYIHDQEMENQIQLGLKEYVAGIPVCDYMQSILGVGPILATSFYVHIKLNPPPEYQGSIRRFCGIDPTIRWYSRKEASQLLDRFDGDINAISHHLNITPATMLRRMQWLRSVQKSGNGPDDILETPVSEMEDKTRKVYYSLLEKAICLCPYNQRMGKILYNLATSFQKLPANKSRYRELIDWRRLQEEERNARGDFKEKAYQIIKDQHVSKFEDRYDLLKDGYLTKHHIMLRTYRWVNGIFISHLHRHAYRQYYRKEPPSLWVHEYGGHKDYIEPEVHWNIPEIEGNSDVIYPWRDGIKTV